MEEMDVFEKMNSIAETPQFSMIFTEDSEQARKVAEHREWLKCILRRPTAAGAVTNGS